VSTDYDNPQDAPETVLAADGKTVLHRFRVDAVIYAASRAGAQQRMDRADIYLDRAALRPEDPEIPAEGGKND
jgi:hypothetical protein